MVQDNYKSRKKAPDFSGALKRQQVDLNHHHSGKQPVALPLSYVGLNSVAPKDNFEVGVP